MLTTSKISTIGRRFFSSVPDNVNIHHPKIGIAKNVLKLKRIAASTCEVSLRAALSDAVTIEQIYAQPDLSVYEDRILATTAKIYHAPFVKNPNMWQNWSNLAILWREIKIDINYCFIGGFAILGWFVAIYVPTTWSTLDPDTRRRSLYLSMLEGRMGHIRSKAEHAEYLAELEANK